MTIENPAARPNRRWDRHPDAQTEASLLVKKLEPLPRQVLGYLATDPSAVVPLDILAAQFGVTAAQVAAAVGRANAFAEAFGFLPLVMIRHTGCQIDSGTAEVVLEALAKTGHP
ncbi:hypothetical protein ACFY05_42940 [Microtetraspora fusca]|uniref:DUF742 domain-containing protein n=1 Tax=Microtetraspora fusca TaxID=1997 RepID=A0ABW6VJQ9_MICFU